MRSRVIFCWVLAVALLGVSRSGQADDPKTKGDSPPEPEISKVEKELIELTNKERAKEKLPALKPNALLFKSARGHSADMAKKGELEHKLDGKNVVDRADAVGYKFEDIGENIAVTDNETPVAIVKLWMGSEGHRANILNKDFVDIGIGVVKNDKGDTYYTQVFGAPKKK
jgi:uncharacterized protein YkwD